VALDPQEFYCPVGSLQNRILFFWKEPTGQ